MADNFIKGLCILVIQFCWYPSIIISQNCQLTISGKILDHHEDHPLDFATIYIPELERGVVCDENGVFNLKDVCPGKYHFILSHIGCESTVEFIEVTDTFYRIFYLEHHAELLHEVEIKGKDIQSKTGNVKYSISKDIIFELNGKNLSEILTSIPGVSTLKAGPNLSKPVINGMYGNRVSILNHGIPQEGQQWGNDHAPEIDPNTADKISVYKGASAVKYGLMALGGIVITEDNQLPTDPHMHGEIKITGQTNGLAAGFNGTLRKSTPIGNIRITGGFNKSGDKKTPDYFLTNTGNQEKSFSLYLCNNNDNINQRKVYYSFYQNEIGILRGSHIGNINDLKEAFTRKTPFFTSDSFSYDIKVPRQLIDHHLFKINQRYFINKNTYLNLDAGYQLNIRKEYDVRRGDRDKKPALNLMLFSQYYDLNLLQNNPIKERSISTGIQYRYTNNTNTPGTGVAPLIPDYINQHLAMYFIYKSKLGSFPLEMGVRTEYRNYNVYILNTDNKYIREALNYLSWAANVGITKKIMPDLQTNLDISFTNRPPEVNELFSKGLHQGVSGIEEGNAQLKSEKSFKIVHEWSGPISRNFQITASFFYNYISNFIYLQPQKELRLTIRGAFPVFSYVGTDVSMGGVSIKSTQTLFSSLSWSNSINYIYARNISAGTGLIRIPALNAFTNLAYTSGKTKIYHECKSGLEMNYTGKQTNVPLSEDFIAPPDGYFILNAFVRFKWKQKNNQDIDLSIRAENLLNTRYRDYLNRLRYFADETGRNYSFNIRITF